MSAAGRLDLRLAAPAGAAWATAASLVAGSAHRAGVAAVLASIVAGVAAGVAGSSPNAAGWHVVVAVALGVAAGAATTAVHLLALQRGPVAEAASQRSGVRLDARLVRDPVEVTSHRGRRLVVTDVTVTSLHPAGTDGPAQPARSPVVVFSSSRSWLGLLPGQRVRFRARLAARRPGDDVAAVAFAHGAPTLLGRPPPWQRAAGRVRAALRAAVAGLPADERGLVPGLVVGDVSAMPTDLTVAFRTVGLSHLNAVSGENLAILLGTVTAVVRRAGARRGLRVAVAATSLVAFVVLARPSPSVLRAAVMGGLVIIGVARGRRAAPVPLLAAAVLGLVVVDPFLARAAGFTLSVLATLAIVTVAPRWTTRLSRRLPRPLAAAVAVPAAAQLACTPVIAAVFGQLAPWAVPANLLAAPAVPLATLAGMTTAVSAVAVPSVARAVAWVAALPAGWLALVARDLARLPGAGARWPSGAMGGGLAVLGIVCLAVAVRAVRSRPAHGMLPPWRP